MPSNKWFEFLAERGFGEDVADAMERIVTLGVAESINGSRPCSLSDQRHILLAEQALLEVIDNLRESIADDEEDGPDES